MFTFENATMYYYNNKQQTAAGHWLTKSDLDHITKYKKISIDGQIVKFQNMYIEEKIPYPNGHYNLVQEKHKIDAERSRLIKLGLNGYNKQYSTFDFDKMIEENPEYFI